MDIEGVFRIIGGLVPEPTNDPTELYHWNKRVGLTLMATLCMVLAIGFATAAAFGLVPSVHPGFVKTIELTPMQEKLDTRIATVEQQVIENNKERKKQWATQLDTALIDTRSKHCKAKNDEGRRVYWDSISRMMGQYRDLTGDLYQLPACSDL